MSTSRATWRRRSRSSSALALLGLVLLGSSGAQAGTDRPVALAFDRTHGYETRLLACLASEFQCSPVAFAVPSGRRYTLRVGRRNELTAGMAISRGGAQVLVEAGRLEGQFRALAVPLAQGKPRVLVRNAEHASWSR